MTLLPEVVVISMPLKLLQTEQYAIINYFPNSKVIVLSGNNNYKLVQLNIARRNYTHVFTSFEIALSKKFRSAGRKLIWRRLLLGLGIT